MKTLKSQSVKIASVYYNLKAIPPKEFKTTDDMEKQVVIVEKLGNAVPKFRDHFVNGDEQKSKIISGEIKSNGLEGDKNNIQEIYKEFDRKTEELIRDFGKDIVEVEFEDAEFNTLFIFNTSWGKNWFSKVPEYLDWVKDLNETNRQPKQEKVKK